MSEQVNPSRAANDDVTEHPLSASDMCKTTAMSPLDCLPSAADMDLSEECHNVIAEPDGPATAPDLGRVGRYRLVRELGRGGIGVV